MRLSGGFQNCIHQIERRGRKSGPPAKLRCSGFLNHAKVRNYEKAKAKTYPQAPAVLLEVRGETDISRPDPELRVTLSFVTLSFRIHPSSLRCPVY